MIDAVKQHIPSTTYYPGADSVSSGPNAPLIAAAKAAAAQVSVVQRTPYNPKLLLQTTTTTLNSKPRWTW
jgi:hypothetical protein